jgi:cholesterol 7-dehydrogenase
MGAHLGVGGRVRYDTCIECPFHGWTFDGETGHCVLSGGDNKIIRIADKYQYYDIDKCSPIPSNNDQAKSYLQKVTEQQEIKQKKYTCREMNGSILVWYHSDENLRENPLYEPFDVSNELKINKMEGKKKEISLTKRKHNQSIFNSFSTW